MDKAAKPEASSGASGPSADSSVLSTAVNFVVPESPCTEKVSPELCQSSSSGGSVSPGLPGAALSDRADLSVQESVVRGPDAGNDRIAMLGLEAKRRRADGGDGAAFDEDDESVIEKKEELEPETLKSQEEVISRRGLARSSPAWKMIM